MIDTIIGIVGGMLIVGIAFLLSTFQTRNIKGK